MKRIEPTPKKEGVSLDRAKSKYFNTAARMDEALIELLEKKDFEYITVKEICEKAGVNRSTFYLHYETVGMRAKRKGQLLSALRNTRKALRTSAKGCRRAGGRTLYSSRPNI